MILAFTATVCILCLIGICLAADLEHERKQRKSWEESATYWRNRLDEVYGKNRADTYTVQRLLARKVDRISTSDGVYAVKYKKL